MMELYLHPPYVFTVWCLIKHRDKFAFFLHGSLKARKNRKKTDVQANKEKITNGNVERIPRLADETDGCVYATRRRLAYNREPGNY
jgi:hypothetical protein